METIKQKGNPVSFLIFPKLNEWIRYSVSAFIITLALYLQVFQKIPFPGYFILLIASLLLMFKGIDKRVLNNSLRLSADWDNVNEEQLRNIPEMYKKLRRWDISFFELSSCTGWLVFMIIVLSAIFFIVQDNFFTVIGIDILILFFPLYLSGMLKIDLKPALVRKVEKILMVSQYCQQNYPDCKLEYPVLKFDRKADEHKVPADAKIKITPTDNNKDFLGIYGQCTMNTISGTLYPYFYFVIVYKDSFNPFSQIRNFDLKPNTLIEKTSEKGVNVLVIRQMTTRTSGYETNDKSINGLLDTTLKLHSYINGK